jgi:hypothetical protein
LVLICVFLFATVGALVHLRTVAVGVEQNLVETADAERARLARVAGAGLVVLDLRAGLHEISKLGLTVWVLIQVGVL